MPITLNFKPISVLVILAGTGVGQVSVPALIMDGSGKTPHGLSKSEFAVRCGNDATFDSVEEVSALNFASFSDPTPVFILFDALSVPPPAQGQVAQQLLKYLRRAADENLAVTVLVNSAHGVQLIHDMSTETSVFLAAMDRVVPASPGKQSDRKQPNATESFTKAVTQEVQQLQVLTSTIPYASSYKTTLAERKSITEEDAARRDVEKQELESLRQTGEIFRRSHKRKLLVWLTGYFPFNISGKELSYGNYAMPYGRGRPKIKPDMVALYQTAVDSLNDSRMSVFPVFVADARNYNVRVLAKDTLDGLGEIALRTGGSMTGILDEIDFQSQIGSLRKHFDSYYIVNFKLESAHRNSWIDDDIKVNGPGLKVAAMPGFFAEK